LFMGPEPFHTVYVHALVRDERGQTMSKSKGNVIDPLELIDEFGCDALRFILASLAAPGRDIKLAKGRVEGARNFATKLWNAARFCEMNDCRLDPAFDPAMATQTVNRWIVGATAECAQAVERGIESYRFNDAAQTIYHFIWGTYCDWYLEFAKPLFTGSDAAATAETRATAAWVLDQILLLLHPFMPFITEELWETLGAKRDGLLMLADWPVYPASFADAKAAREMDWVVRLIAGIRSIRAEMNVPPAAQIPMTVLGSGPEAQGWLATHKDLILRLARLSGIETDGEVPAGAVQLVHDEATVALPLAQVIDLAAEKQRLEKAIAKAEDEIGKLSKKLGNAQFVAKAPEEVVEEQRERLAETEAMRVKLGEALGRLAAL
ncbi:MAG: class I tRNA ligase family protein, partial [Alphaproteobacteria bacterium]